MVRITQRGDLKKTEKFLSNILGRDYLMKVLHKYGQEGVRALSAATPVDTGRTAASWSYEVIEEDGRCIIAWTNSNIQKYVNIAIILQYGHATRNGGWVAGRDYINPAIRSVFDHIADAAWKEVTSK